VEASDESPASAFSHRFRLAGLKATGKIDPVIMGYIETADNAINAALAAVQKAKQGVDPSLLKPIDPVP
jgi:hypothetical protein